MASIMVVGFLAAILVGVYHTAKNLEKINLTLNEIKGAFQSLENGMGKIKNDTVQIVLNTDSSQDLV